MFFGEKTMARLQRMGELYAGNEANAREIRNLKRISAANRYAQMHSRSSSHRTMADLFRAPIGGGMVNQTKTVNIEGLVASRGDQPRVGEILWSDPSGIVTEKARGFVGVMTLAQNKSKYAPVAYAGTIPVRLKGKFQAGQAVFVDRGGTYGVPSANGDSMLLGIYSHADSPDSEDNEYLGLVRIGFIAEIKDRPFIPTIRKKDDAWEVSLTPGWIVERLSKTENAILFHEVPEILDDNDQPIWHQIADGKTAYVYYKTKGSVGEVIKDSIKMTIAENDKESKAYKPKCEEEEKEGEYWYSLFEFTLNDKDLPKIISKHSGENIKHYAERADMKNLGGGDQKVFKKYDQETNEYQFRTFKSVGSGKRILKEEEKDAIEIRTIVGSVGDSATDSSGIEVIELDADTLKVQPKGASGECTWSACDGSGGTILEVKDGMVVKIGGVIKVGECNEGGGTSSSNSSIP
jgi:hypothetical protein